MNTAIGVHGEEPLVTAINRPAAGCGNEFSRAGFNFYTALIVLCVPKAGNSPRPVTVLPVIDKPAVFMPFIGRGGR